MSRTVLSITLAGAALAAAGCTLANREAPPAPAATPMATPIAATRHGASHGDAHYALGRYYQGQVRYDDAIKAYQEVLAAQPDHAEAHNALGVIYATQGRWDMAEAELRTALNLAPSSAHIHNNLGYAQLLQGHPAEAATAFEEALRLDPNQARAADNLRIAQARLAGRPVAAAPAPVKAEPPRPQVPSVAVVAPTPQASPVSANIIELRLPAPPRNDGRLAAAPAASAAPLPAGLEVANGNGVPGLAKQASAYFKGMGYGRVRLTNQKPFVLGQTQIQFRPGYQQQAEGLRTALAGKGVLSPSASLRQDIQVRVVLGKDLRAAPRLAEGEEPEPIRLAGGME
ncbi:MAG TPA: tetratricopeptide repeat protein [Rhodocyclaceae bacterium]|nr:tetratricopeptide repeat protein [Rhodocyclaceae bacterium]